MKSIKGLLITENISLLQEFEGTLTNLKSPFELRHELVSEPSLELSRRLESTKPDLAFLDYSNPEKAKQMLNFIKNHAAECDVVAITADISSATLLDAVRHGVR